MTELLSRSPTPSDAELIARVRGGDGAAYGELFSRHVDAANRHARQLVRGPDADDLVSEAFTKVLQLMQDGGGPDVAFRAYLLTAVRRLHVDRVRAAARLQPSDDMSQFDPGVPFLDTAVAGFEHGAAARAFASLPERWQLVLWHLEVEGQRPADVAPLLGMSPNSVSALAYRAREGLRQAFLTMHLSDLPSEECRWVNDRLGGYVRKGLSRRDTAKVDEHLEGCRRCTAVYLELSEVNSNLAGIVGPLVLGAAAAGYLSASASVGTGGLLALVGRVRDLVSANAGATTAGAVAAGVATAASIGFLVVTGGEKEVVVEAKEPVGVLSPTAGSTPPTRSPAPTPSEPRPSATGETRSSRPAGVVVPAAVAASAVPAPAPGTTQPTGGPTTAWQAPTTSAPESVAVAPPETTDPSTTPASTPPPSSPPAGIPTSSPPATTAPPAPAAAFGFASGPSGTLVSGNTHRVTASVHGVPDTGVVVSVTLGDEQQTFLSVSEGCDLAGDVMLCPVGAGTTELSLAFDARLPAHDQAQDGEDRTRGSLTVSVDHHDLSSTAPIT